MITVIVSQTIKAPPEVLMTLYADYSNWGWLFPLIKDVRVVRQEGDRTVLDVHHVEGHVPNVLRQVSPETFELWEDRRKYTATFLNRFQAAPGGAKYTVVAHVELKRLWRLLAPFAGAIVRRKIKRYVIEPIKAAAETGVVAIAR